jgi:hypothetical protein
MATELALWRPNAIDKHRPEARIPIDGAVCTENLIRVDDVMESPKLAE